MNALEFVKKYVALPVGIILQLFGYFEAIFNLTGIPRTFLIASSGFLMLTLLLVWFIWFSDSCQTSRQKKVALVGLVVVSTAYYFFVQFNLLLNVRNDTFRQVMDLESARDLLASDPRETVVKLTNMTGTLANVAELYNVRGVAHSKLRQHGEALKDFRKAAELNPKNRQYVYNTAVELSKMCDLEGAKKVFDEYVTKNEDEIRGRFARGAVRHMLGEYALALQDYGVVLANRDNDMAEAALFNSAVIYAAKFKSEAPNDLNQEYVDKAIKYLERSLELGKEGRFRKILDALEVHTNAEGACAIRSAVDDLTSLRSVPKFQEWLNGRQNGGSRWLRSS